MSATDFIIVLQFAVIILLCEPQKRRPQTVRVLTALFFGFIILRYALRFIAPAALGFLVDIFQPVFQRIGWGGSLCILVGLGYAIPLCVAVWSDAKENRAIRAGSEVAFNKRVETYLRGGKSEEEAIAITTGIRDGK